MKNFKIQLNDSSPSPENSINNHDFSIVVSLLLASFAFTVQPFYHTFLEEGSFNLSPTYIFVCLMPFIPLILDLIMNVASKFVKKMWFKRNAKKYIIPTLRIIFLFLLVFNYRFRNWQERSETALNILSIRRAEDYQGRPPRDNMRHLIEGLNKEYEDFKKPDLHKNDPKNQNLKPPPPQDNNPGNFTASPQNLSSNNFDGSYNSTNADVLFQSSILNEITTLNFILAFSFCTILLKELWAFTIGLAGGIIIWFAILVIDLVSQREVHLYLSLIYFFNMVLLFVLTYRVFFVKWKQDKKNLKLEEIKRHMVNEMPIGALVFEKNKGGEFHLLYENSEAKRIFGSQTSEAYLEERLFMEETLKAEFSPPHGIRSKMKTLKQLLHEIFNDEVDISRSYQYRKSTSQDLKNFPFGVADPAQQVSDDLNYEVAFSKLSENRNSLLVIFKEISHAAKILQIRETTQFKTQLLAGFSHELKTSLNGAVSIIDCAIEDQSVPVSIKDTYLVQPQKSLQMLNHLIGDITDFLKLELNQLKFNHSKFSLIGVINKALDIVSMPLKSKGLELIQEIERKTLPSTINSDEDRLLRILTNLLLHCIKHTFSGFVKIRVFGSSIRYAFINFEISDSRFSQPRKDPKSTSKIDLQMTMSGPNAPRAIAEDLGLIISKRLSSHISSPKKVKHSIFNRAGGTSPHSIFKKPDSKTTNPFEETLRRSSNLLLGEGKLAENEIKVNLSEGIEIETSGTGLMFKFSVENKTRDPGNTCLSREFLILGEKLSSKGEEEEANSKVSVEMETLGMNTPCQKPNTSNMYTFFDRTKINKSKKNSLDRRSFSFEMVPVHQEIENKHSNLKSSLEEVALGLFNAVDVKPESNNTHTLSDKESLKSHQIRSVPQNLSDATTYVIKTSFVNIDDESKKLILDSTFSPLLNPPKEESSTSLKLLPDDHIPDTQPHTLIVDDNPFNLMSLELVLKKFGIKCAKAMNGMQALEFLQDQENNMLFKDMKWIFMDIFMPIMDGLQACRKIKKLASEGLIPDFKMIACSANDSLEDIEKCKQAGFDHFIPKPITYDKLKRVIDLG